VAYGRSWQRVTGQATIIYGEVMPEKRRRDAFCDMYGAYERLDASWKGAHRGLRAVHNLDFLAQPPHGEDPLTEAQRLASRRSTIRRAHASGNAAQMPVPGDHAGVHPGQCRMKEGAR
jgi:alpha-ketoglutarate-dependent taurine dioxygenase